MLKSIQGASVQRAIERIMLALLVAEEESVMVSGEDLQLVIQEVVSSTWEIVVEHGTQLPFQVHARPK